MRDHHSRANLVKADPIARTPVARLTVADVERWHGRLRTGGIGEGALRNRHQALRASLTQAVRWGWVPANVAALARLKLRKAAPRGAMDADQVRSVLEAARQIEPAAELALRLAAVTGARRAELAALRWEDVDGGRITIDSSVAIVRDHPDAHHRRPVLVDEATKTANRRTLTLDPATLALVDQQRSERGRYCPWMFGLDQDPPNPDRIGYWWRQSREKAGLDPAWRLHDLRHWSATVAIASGHDVRTVANRLGHANAALTLSVYAHALDAGDRQVAATMGELLEPPDAGSEGG